MRRPALFLTILALLGLGSGPMPLGAAPRDVMATSGTKAISFAEREWLEVGLDVEGISVDRLKLHPPGKLTRLFTRHDEANRGSITITNGTDRKVHPRVAISIFDAEGHLLAAANTGKSILSLNPGKTKEFDIHFGGVFRHVRRGEHIYIALEF